MDQKIKALYQKICDSKHCVALSGAGVSTLSGIRDFRGKNGLYQEFDASKIFDIDYFEHDPSYYYKTAGEFIYNADAYPASIVHTCLSELEKKGLIKAIITQNVDFLHQKGGALHVIEVHGSPAVHYCMRCSGIRVPFNQVVEIVKKGMFPVCPKCNRILKPAITFFGERLPLEAMREAESEASLCDLMLVLGTSLSVYPAAALPETALRHGASIVIVNNMPTSLDRYALMKFDELQPVFEGLHMLCAQ
ncbi:MAG: NAD-dependent deacetylase [Spirochaetaceae bacterium]|jgi:NAD-dependent deacetylase|nr:NAD-dependent deacetylase [Spirochaetaceae bacterium]